MIEKCQCEERDVQDCGSTSNAVWFRDCGTKEKTEGRAGGGTDEDVGEVEEDDFNLLMYAVTGQIFSIQPSNRY